MLCCLSLKKRFLDVIFYLELILLSSIIGATPEHPSSRNLGDKDGATWMLIIRSIFGTNKKTWAASLAREYIFNTSRWSKWHFSKSIWVAFTECILDYSGQYKNNAENCISKFGKLRFYETWKYAEIAPEKVSSAYFLVRLLVPPISKHFLIKLDRWNFACSILTTFLKTFFSRISYRRKSL